MKIQYQRKTSLKLFCNMIAYQVTGSTNPSLLAKFEEDYGDSVFGANAMPKCLQEQYVVELGEAIVE